MEFGKLKSIVQKDDAENSGTEEEQNTNEQVENDIQEANENVQ